MKKRVCLTVVFIFLLQLCTFAEEPQKNAAWKEVYVAMDGNDSAAGTKEAPFATVGRAQEYVREISPDMAGNIVVHIASGTYFLQDTLRFTNADSGRNGYRVIYQGENMPVLSGGVPAGAFEPSGRDGIYKAKVDGVSMMREMYVNGKKAYVANSGRQVTGIAYYNDPTTSYEFDGMYMSKLDIGCYENPEDIELNWQVNWKNNTAKVQDILPDPDNPDQVIVKMQQNWWDYLSQKEDDGYCAKPYRPFLIKNAFELLDKPGEFYYNKKEKTVYYIPRAGEDLKTAEVIAPRLDKLIKIDGNDADDRVENITFSGIKFAHALFYGPDEGGIETGQQQNFSRTNDIPWYMPATIQLARTDGIEFSNNYFFGYGAAGFDLSDGVSNTVINGNAFSDIGDAAIFIGRHSHGGKETTYESVQVKPPEDSGECNLIDGKVKLATSYQGNFGALAGSRNWVSEDDYDLGGTWYADPYAVRNKQKSWVRYDFDAPYSISRIRLGFAPGDVSGEEKSGYEVLLSNDREFTEGSYVTVGTQVAPAAALQDYYPEQDGKKYRYLMIRTLDATKFALSKVWAFTPDRKPYTVEVPTKDNTISNNYITRSGETICSGGGISCFYTSGLRIVGNEISDIPYSGIMFGWGWDNKAYGSGNNYVANNYIHSTNNTMHDGGAVYSLSSQEGTVVENNYVETVFIGQGAYYPDEGTARSVWRNNVSEDVRLNYHVWQSTIRENQFLSSYGWHGLNRNDGRDNVFEDTRVYLPGNEPGKAHEIMMNAGLRPEYRHLKEMVPEAELEVEEPRVILAAQWDSTIESLAEYVQTVAESMLEQGNFGNQPGDYPIQYRFTLESALEELVNRTNPNYTDTLLKLRQLIMDTKNNIHRTTLNDLIAQSRENLLNTPSAQDRNIENSVTPAQKKAFEKVLAEVVEKNRPEISAGDAFELLKKLEAAYRSFEDEKAGFGVEYLYVEGMTGETIDRENRTITVTMPANIPLEHCRAEVLTEGTAQSAVFEDYLNFSRDFRLPVYSESVGDYRYWTVKTVVQDEGAEWMTIARETNTVMPMPDGNYFLSAHKTPYIQNRYFGKDEAQAIRFIPKTGQEKNSFTFLFGVNTAADFEMTTEYPKDDHFRLEITDGVAKMIAHEAGTDTLLKEEIQFPVQYNAENEIRVQMLPVAGRTNITVWLNGRLTANVLADRRAWGGYIGFYTDKIGIKAIRQTG